MTAPELVIAQVKSVPVDMATAVVFVPKSTLTGEFLLEFEPSPSWPRLLRPQQLTEPSVRIAQLWLLPFEIAAVWWPPKFTVPFD